MPKPRAKHSQQRHQLRIIGGQWRGRKLAIANVDGLRPTGDRIRETLFNWLTGELHHSHCLDLFAGSGALGFECLSRGAAKVSVIEKHPLAAQQLTSNAELLKANNVDIIHADSGLWLKSTDTPKRSINIVFIDPPFAENLWDATINLLEESDLLADDAAIYIETPKDLRLTTPPSWSLSKQKQTGAVSYQLYRKSTENDSV